MCTCCHQTWFSDSVVDAHSLHDSLAACIQHCLTNYKSVDNIEWICHTCQNSLKKAKIPRLSISNKMGFPEKPKELQLYPLEERLISLRIPFMQIRQLTREEQISINGNVVNVPVDIQPTINSLPRTLEQSGTIAVKLKKKLAFKKCDFSENVRPLAVVCALHYLMNKSEMYKSSGIQVDDYWITKIEEVSRVDAESECNQDSEYENDSSGKEQQHDEDDSDHFSEIDETDVHVGNTDTLLDEILDDTDSSCDNEYIFAPGEGQRPISLYYDADAEYLSFPSIFCGQRRIENTERSVPVHYTDVVK